MAEFFGFLKVFVMCGTVFFITMTVLLALPQSKLRSVGLEMSKWALVCGLLLMVPSPVDVLPDVVPGIGWLDDIGYILGAICAANSAMSERKRRTMLEEAEFDQTLAAKRGETSQTDSDDDDQREAA
ncbi:hypothetical protein RAS2_16400 [Phycisphaerae bacterium RAS2]|nr:hypothetical protein RAS2_16400 [Phycisphaerae bacterium RAS2]